MPFIWPMSMSLSIWLDMRSNIGSALIAVKVRSGILAVPLVFSAASLTTLV